MRPWTMPSTRTWRSLPQRVPCHGLRLAGLVAATNCGIALTSPNSGHPPKQNMPPRSGVAVIRSSMTVAPGSSSLQNSVVTYSRSVSGVQHCHGSCGPPGWGPRGCPTAGRSSAGVPRHHLDEALGAGGGGRFALDAVEPEPVGVRRIRVPGDDRDPGAVARSITGLSTLASCRRCPCRRSQR